jgi:hypothetical protein
LYARGEVANRTDRTSAVTMRATKLPNFASMAYMLFCSVAQHPAPATDLELTVGQINNAKRRIRRTLGSELGQLLELFDERPSAVPEER